MKKILALLLALLMLGAVVACTGKTTPDETMAETNPETTPETESETQGETLPEVLEAVQNSRVPKAKTARIIYRFPDTAEAKPTLAHKMLLCSFMGLAAKHSDEQIMIDGGVDKLLPTYIESLADVTISDTVGGEPVSLESLARYYKDKGFIQGYILYDDETLENGDTVESAYVAASLAGVLNALTVTEETRSILDEAGYTCILDVTDKDDAWLRQSEYWELLNRDVVFMQGYANAPHLLDYIVMCNGYVNYYTGSDEATFMKIYDWVNPGCVMFGFNTNYGEFNSVFSLSQMNIQMVPAVLCYNLSVFSGLPLQSVTQKTLYDADPAAENVHTVAFLLSDGDNLAWSCNAMLIWDNYFPSRGGFDMGWGYAPVAIDVLPATVAYMYDNMTERDEFVMSLSGIGYTFPSLWSEEERARLTADVAEYVGRTDIRWVEILDHGGWNKEVFEDFTEHDEIDGLFYIDFVQYDGMNGSIMWTNGKPAVAARYSLTGGTEFNYPLIRDKINQASTNPEKRSAYSLVVVHNWSTDINHVRSLIGEFDSDVDVVTPGEMMERLIYNLKPEDK